MPDQLASPLPAVKLEVIRPPATTVKQRALIADFDLYHHVGGGQSAYRAIIAQNPDTQYYYFTEGEADDAPRPANATPIRHKLHYIENRGDLPAEMGHFYDEYLRCWQLARSFVEAAPGVDLDVIDCPDYRTLALFLRAAFEHHNVKVGVVSLALHGTITSALRDDWAPQDISRLLAEVRLRERLQYRTVDTRYALSEAYAEEWRRVSGGISANLIDPLLIVGEFAPAIAKGDHAPDLAFIGRRERRKGPDLFIDIVWSLDRASYRRAMIIGQEAKGHSGRGSQELLERLARMREVDISFVEPVPRAELDAMFAERIAVVLPSRYDQFNLIALEALRLGAPAFVSDQAGVARWLRANLPEFPELVFDISSAREGARAVRKALADYDGYRAKLVEVLAKKRFATDDASLQRMHAPRDRASDTASEALSDITNRFDSFNQPRDLRDIAGPNAAPQFANNPELAAWKRWVMASPLRVPASYAYRAKNLVLEQLRGPAPAASAPDPTEIERLQREIADRSERARTQVEQAAHIEGTRQRLLRLGERTSEDITAKLAAISQETQSILVARGPIFRDMARLERKYNRNPLVAATYCARLIRWMGEDVYGDLDFVCRTFTEHGFAKEAEAMEAQYRSPRLAFDQSLQLLKSQYDAQRTKRQGGFALFDDRRGDAMPRVSVIVSLYNAASKLDGFLRALAAQSIAGDMEVILIDSGSPTREVDVFRAFCERESLPIVYARSAARETIQAAWNRGIALARAPYLSFLGVDEAVHPDCFAILANVLDKEPSVDWAMADSIVSNVDKRGGFVSDVMVYDRAGYDQSLVYLETCYLSWVGGLYRRSIHERFGYYDETFRAAGDTEFKSRILPHIRTKHVPMRLGMFNNYPEERTTQHPRAEIEDQRAWYLARSPAGMAYAFDGAPISEVENLFRKALSYRKSYCGHLSTDFDLAQAAALYMVRRGENEVFASAALASSSAMVKRIRELEAMDFRLDPETRRLTVARALAAARRQEQDDQRAFALNTRPRYELFNDNRYEQHWYSWSG